MESISKEPPKRKQVGMSPNPTLRDKGQFREYQDGSQRGSKNKELLIHQLNIESLACHQMKLIPREVITTSTLTTKVCRLSGDCPSNRPVCLGGRAEREQAQVQASY